MNSATQNLTWTTTATTDLVEAEGPDFYRNAFGQIRVCCPYVQVATGDFYHVSNVVGFGVTDSKGREFGAFATIEQKAGKFIARVQSARGGEKFGAINVNETTCATWDEAMAVVTKKIAESAKRAVKKAG